MDVFVIFVGLRFAVYGFVVSVESIIFITSDFFRLFVLLFRFVFIGLYIVTCVCLL